MTNRLAAARRRFAEQIGAAATLPAAIVDAFANVPRERFLNPGPWQVWGERDAGPRPTPDNDPMHVYANQAIAIDAERHLFNGLPSFLGMTIAARGLRPGHRALHIGPGLGYYTALIGELVGPEGSVLGIEVDADLAARARSLVLPGAPVEIRHGDGAGPLNQAFDAILVNAGVTHPQTAWLDALVAGGRLVMPLTAPMPVTTANIGKGLMVLLTRGSDGEFAARILSHVAIYSALGLRDRALEAELTAPMLSLKGALLVGLTRRPHARAAECFLHTPEWCIRRS